MNCLYWMMLLESQLQADLKLAGLLPNLYIAEEVSFR